MYWYLRERWGLYCTIDSLMPRGAWTHTLPITVGAIPQLADTMQKQHRKFQKTVASDGVPAMDQISIKHQTLNVGLS